MIKGLFKFVFLLLMLLCIPESFALTNENNVPAVPLVIGVETPIIDGEEGYEAELGSKITLHVQNLDTLLRKAEVENKKIVLYIDDMAIAGLYPLSIDSEHDNLVFILKRTDTSREIWATLLGKPTSVDKHVSLSVGFETGYTAPTIVNIELIRMPLLNITLWGIASLVLLILFYYLASKTPILRIEDRNSPYSLARTQMMLWTYVVAIAYLFIWIVIKEVNTVTESILILLGISITTALGAVYVDTEKRRTYNKLIAEKNALAAIILETQNGMAAISETKLAEIQNDLNDKKIQLSRLNQKITEFPILELEKVKSYGFARDLLTDSNGYSLHRLQMFLWTIILICIFINSVYTTLAMPNFDATLLTLMGISSGTYVGFKLPEK